MLTKTIAALALSVALAQAGFANAALAQSASAETAREVLGSTPFLPVANEPAPKLVVDAPLAEPLARGVAIIQYRTENFRILPVFGSGALDVSPRAGHLHVTVDDLPWHWADAGGTNTIVVAGLPAGQHKILLEIADPTHRVIGGQTVAFTVPAATAHVH